MLDGKSVEGRLTLPTMAWARGVAASPNGSRKHAGGARTVRPRLVQRPGDLASSRSTEVPASSTASASRSRSAKTIERADRFTPRASTVTTGCIAANPGWKCMPRGPEWVCGRRRAAGEPCNPELLTPCQFLLGCFGGRCEEIGTLGKPCFASGDVHRRRLYRSGRGDM